MLGNYVPYIPGTSDNEDIQRFARDSCSMKTTEILCVYTYYTLPAVRESSKQQENHFCSLFCFAINVLVSGVMCLFIMLLLSIT